MACSIHTFAMASWWLMLFLVLGVFSQDPTNHSHPHQRKQHASCPACLDSRLLQHYIAKSCTPVIYGQCSCPSRYKCSSVPSSRRHEVQGVLMMAKLSDHSSFRGRSLDQDDEDLDVCFYNETRYELGEVVPTEDVCRICVCGYLPDGSLGVDCETRIECPTTRSTSLGAPLLFNAYNHRLTRNLGPLPFKLHCYDFYEHDKCCPRQECMPVHARTGRTLRPRKSCLFGGRHYQLGERIDLFSIDHKSEHESEEIATNGINDADDAILKQHWQLPVSFAEQAPCLTCLCTETWNNSLWDSSSISEDLVQTLLRDTKSCRKKNCQLDLDPRFRAGCIPVYDEDKCCPVNYICPRTRSMSLRIRGLDAGSKLCQFEGRKYPVGARLYQTQHAAAPCVDCECRVPPDFTCLQRKHCLAPPTSSDI